MDAYDDSPSKMMMMNHILRDFNMVEDVGDKVFSKLSFHCKQKTFYVRLVQNYIQY
jgi:hypothetical protein